MIGTNPNPSPRSIRETMEQLDAKQLSVSELIAEVLTRIQQTDESVQAWLDVRPKYLMDTAAAYDRRRSLPKPATALYGIPIGVKDIIDVSSYQTVCNMESREHVDPAIRDADVVHAMRQSGVIYLGKTVTQEAAAGIFSDPCTNPWNTGHIPGGSSGGSAAAIANGTALGAFGTDTGGSIRIPASLCGVTGLKPTYGRISTKGIFPLAPSLDTPGPMAATVADTMALYLAMIGKHREIPAMWDRFPQDATSLKGKRIGIFANFFNERVQPDVALAMNAAVATLAELGAEIVEITWTDAEAARYAAGHISRIECAQVHRELVRSAPDTMGEQLRSRVEVGAILPADSWFAALAARDRATSSIARLYNENNLDAALTLSTPITAPAIGSMQISFANGDVEDVTAALTRFTAPWNATGQPVLAVPAGVDSSGMPIGLSFVGRPDDEWSLADIAHAFEVART